MVKPNLDRPSPAEVREAFVYDPKTGVFRWRCSNGRRAIAGNETGHCDNNGYRRIHWHGRNFLCSHLAWAYVTGDWPTSDIDHRNTVRSDDRFDNLRLATPSQNHANRRRSRHNTSGIKGVDLYRRPGRKPSWRARLSVNGRRIHLGYFKSKEEATAAYTAAALRHFGEFARPTITSSDQSSVPS